MDDLSILIEKFNAWHILGINEKSKTFSSSAVCKRNLGFSIK